MLYLVVAIMLGIMYGIEFLDIKREERSRRAVEKTHSQLYELIDNEFGDTPAQARERKAEVDMTIHSHWNDIGRDYRPASLKEVTTKTERAERDKACREGRYSQYSAQKYAKAQVLDAIEEAIIDKMVEAMEREPQGSIEYAITQNMARCGISREEATRRVSNFIQTMC